MVPTPSTKSAPLLAPERATLLQVARASIAHGMHTGKALGVRVGDYSPALWSVRASFVTLHTRNQLRGCIGHLESVQPLVVDVAENAFSAAFRDPRFPPLRPAEFQSLQIHISVLTPLEPLACASEVELLMRLQPGKDGLVLESGGQRGTFLPSVWESIPETHEFLQHLKLKAGLTATQWPADLRVYRYQTDFFEEAP